MKKGAKELDASIIITAYRKRPYLMDALKSALNQDYEREKYEVILVKNFEDREVEGFCASNGIKVVNSNKEYLMSTILDGVSVSGSNVILLLEDDDMFAQNKVKTITEYFSKNPDVGCVHNNYITLKLKTTDGSAKSYKKGVQAETKIFYDNISELSRVNLVNLSSMSFKKDVLLGIASLTSQALKLNMEFLELALFYATLVFGYKCAFIPSFLTIFRVHRENTTTNPKIIPHLCNSLEFFFSTLSELSKRGAHPEVLLRNLSFHKFVWETYCKIKRRERVSALKIFKMLLSSKRTYSRKRLAQLFLFSIPYNILYPIIKGHGP